MTKATLKRAWDRLVAVQRHYERAEGDIYAAGITYFTIFALFPLLMMAFAVVGFMLASRPSLLAEIDSKVKAAVPADFANQVLTLMDSAIASRTSVGLIGLGTAVYVGLLWMQRLREALSRMWDQTVVPMGFVKTKLSDLGSLGSAFVASLLTIGLTALADPALRLTGLVRVGSLVVSVLVAWALFTWIIARLPRLPVPVRRCLRAGLIAAVGFEAFKQLGSIYLKTVMHGPAGAAFGPVVGLMVFAYITARLVLFSTAWAATDGVSEPEPADSANGQP